MEIFNQESEGEGGGGKSQKLEFINDPRSNIVVFSDRSAKASRQSAITPMGELGQPLPNLQLTLVLCFKAIIPI